MVGLMSSHTAMRVLKRGARLIRKPSNSMCYIRKPDKPLETQGVANKAYSKNCQLLVTVYNTDILFSYLF